MYVGVVVASVPVGAIVTGASGTEGPVAEIVIVVAPLHGPVPSEFVAFTNQLYTAPLLSELEGTMEQVPVPAPQPAAAGATDMLTATPAVFCTSR